LDDGPEGLLRPADGPGSLTPGMKVSVRISGFEPARERLDLEFVDLNLQSENNVHMDKGGETQ
jgi:hypothetical protein